jgi:alpha-D-xyloside xylohydrolase
MRGLAMDFPGDSAVKNIADQYLFGPSLLISPVCTFGAKSRQLYLPAGQGWYDFYSGKYAEGGRHIDADAPYERMPVFVKEGSIIPVGPEMQYTEEKPADPITLYVYTGRNAGFSLYEDENTNYNYERGIFSNIPVRYNESAKTLTIGKREGAFPGMLQSRTFRIIWVSRNKSRELNPDQQADKTVKYNGEAITVSMQ